MKNLTKMLIICMTISCQKTNTMFKDKGSTPPYNNKLCIALTTTQKIRIDAFIRNQHCHDSLKNTTFMQKHCIPEPQIMQLWISYMGGKKEEYGGITEYQYDSHVATLTTPDSTDYLMQIKDDIAKPDSIISFFRYMQQHGLQKESHKMFNKFYEQFYLYKCTRFNKSLLLGLGFSEQDIVQEGVELWAYKNDFHKSIAHVDYIGTPPPLPFSCFYTTILYNKKNGGYKISVKEVPGREGDNGHWTEIFNSSSKDCRCEVIYTM